MGENRGGVPLHELLALRDVVTWNQNLGVKAKFTPQFDSVSATWISSLESIREIKKRECENNPHLLHLTTEFLLNTDQCEEMICS